MTMTARMRRHWNAIAIVAMLFSALNVGALFAASAGAARDGLVTMVCTPIGVQYVGVDAEGGRSAPDSASGHACAWCTWSVQGTAALGAGRLAPPPPDVAARGASARQDPCPASTIARRPLARAPPLLS